MRKLIIPLILFVFFQGKLFSQSCLPEGITFSTQAQIDSFQVNYPGCTEIEGFVSIWSYTQSDINNLNGLNGLTRIRGDLWIGNIDDLTSLTGLNNLNFIGGEVHIGSGYNTWDDYPTHLTSLDGLKNLDSIGGSLSIAFNQNLPNLSGLENLTYLGSNLEIKYNDILTNLDALENIVADSMTDLTIFNNSNLFTCEAQSICNYLASLNGTVNIYNNLTGCDSPQQIANNCGITLPCLPFGNYYLLSQSDIDNFQSDFPDCLDLQGNLSVKGGGITNLNGLNTVTSINGYLILDEIAPLTSLTGLENLTSIGLGLQIWSNYGLTNLSGLDGLSSIGDGLSIWNDDNLNSLTGLEQLTYIGSTLQIIHNASLIMLTGLENLTSISDHVNISDNWNLISLSGLNNIISIEGGLAVTDNYKLTNLIGLNRLTTIGKWLVIRSNDKLINLSGLQSLTSVGDYLQIGDPWSGNRVLANITALQNLTSIGGELMISHNDSLMSLSGLDNIAEGSITDLTISNNVMLSTCEVESICNYLASPNGIIDIQNNNPGCNSQEEVVTACEVGIDESAVGGQQSAVGGWQSAVSIYPNPSSTQIIIQTGETIPKFQLSIFNPSGKEVIMQQASGSRIDIDISHLPGGVYFVRIVDEGSVLVGKFVKTSE
jgi:hypothetical protein